MSMRDVQKWMSSLDEEWLLVLDNSNADDIRQFVPDGKTGNILYTSRRHNLAASLRPEWVAEVNDMEPKDATRLLLLTAGFADDDHARRAEAAAVVEELGYLPLAIDQAGAYIRRMNRSLSAYLVLFKNQREQLIRDPTFKGLLHDPKFKGTDPRNQAVYATFDISYNALRDIMEKHEGSRKGEDARNALNILRLICFYHNDTVMVEIFQRAAIWRQRSAKKLVQPLGHGKESLDNLITIEDDDWDSDPVMLGLMVLEDFSLAKWDDRRENVSMHVLVYDWARASIGNKDMARRAGYAKAILFGSISVDETLQTLSFRRRIYPHVEACIRRAEMSQEDDSICAEYMMKLGTLYQQRGQFQDARNIFHKAISLYRMVNGPDDGSTLFAMSLLSSLHSSEGKLGEAEFVLLQVLELRQMNIDDIVRRQRERGLEQPEHAQLESSPEYLTRVKQKREADAKRDEELLKRLSLRKARTLHKLAGVYVAQTLWDAAERAALRAVEIYEEFAPNSAAPAKRSLQKIRAARNGNFRTRPRLTAEEARARLDEIIRVYGYGDTETMKAMEDLVEAEIEAGNAGAAEEIANEIFARCAEEYGPEHRETLQALRLYSTVLDEKKQFIVSEEYKRGVLAASQRSLGPYHPYTIESLLFLGAGIGNSGRLEEGEMVVIKALEAQEAIFGATHESVRRNRGFLDTIRLSKSRANGNMLRGWARDALRNNHIYTGRTLVEDDEFEEWVDYWVRFNHISQYWDTGLPEQVYFTEAPPRINALFIAEMEEQQARRQLEPPLEHGYAEEFA